MENENLELDPKPAGNKDLWLFLITVDIIFLCIFGFFLYKHFAAGVFKAPTAAGDATTVVEETVSGPEEVIHVEAVEAKEVAAPEPEPVVISAPVEEIPLTAVLEQEAKAEPVQEVAAPAEKKESISIDTSSKGKYRKVTFRWFGEGNKVAIVSGFTMSKPQALKKKGDHWETTLSIAPGTYKFLYIVDGENRTDPYAPEKSGRSIVEIK